jgi:hypothetical protein
MNPSRYIPHQGKRECARRLAQREAAGIKAFNARQEAEINEALAGVPDIHEPRAIRMESQ